MANIVLAHGILGFGDVFPRQPIDYFNGIPQLFTSLGHEVLCPSVAPLGSIENRSSELEAQIVAKWPNDTESIYLLAHSMGGLDCRRMLQRNSSLARRVPRLVTIATPHFGSPVADAVMHPKFSLLPSPTKFLTDFFRADAGALRDLQTRTALEARGVPGVDYVCIGCDAKNATPKSPLFLLTAAVGEFSDIPNDGVVGLPSASATGRASDLAEIWPVDHGGAIGWPSGGIGWQITNAASQPPSDHLGRYEHLLARLLA